MDMQIVIGTTMLAISLVLSGAMAIAWGSFGRPRHALSWSIAYALYGGEILVSIVGAAVPSLEQLWWRLAVLCITAPAAMVAIGARQRAGLPARHKSFAALTAGVTGAVWLLDLLPFPTQMLETVGSLFTAAMFALSVRVILPRDRATLPAEWAMAATMAVFTLYELLLAGLIALRVLHPGDPGVRMLFRTVYLTGLTPLFVANGVAAILLLASDLAAQLRALAINDPLTGVLNRRGFRDAALRLVATARRHKLPLALAVVDIDHFKSINDRFGHTAGDHVLGFVCGRLARGLRKGDLVGRTGGEEFAILLFDSGAEQAEGTIERIRQAIAEGHRENGALIPVTASFGIAPVRFEGSSAEQDLLDAIDDADQALYRSKVAGRNRTTLAAA